MHRFSTRAFFVLSAVLFGVFTASTARAAGLELRKGDHISLIGNVLAERMQHDGWLETLIQARFPEDELSFRNLGFSGDEIARRQRSENFGSPDQWLTRTQTGVVFAFFGYNESFAGEAGLPQFNEELDRFVQHTLSQKYDGQNTARLVLFSPSAFENHNDPNLPDGSEHNPRLELYTQAIAEVAAKHNVPFVDLFHATLKRYEASSEPLTLNGHFLNDRGNRAIAEIIVQSLLPEAKSNLSEASLQSLRAAVQDKNFYWYHRYRTTDGYNVYGGRSQLKYTDGVSNWDVMQREMEVLDAMTANRDKAIWSVAKSGSNFADGTRSVPATAVDDSNTPEFIPVTTNMPGPLPDGKHIFLGGEEAIEKMTVAEGMKVELVASEEMFPELINPVQMAFDTAGRLWVAAWPSYPHWKAKDKMDDKLLILEDSNGDGRADACKTFAGGLHNPTGFEFWNGGVLVAMAPDLLFLKDTDGDDVADVRVHVLHGLDSADTHHTANSFVLAQDGALYFQEGVFHQSQIETAEGAVRNNNACVWRFDPRTWDVDRYIPYDFANPHGHVFDRWGNDFVHDGTSAQPWHGTLFSGHVDFPAKHPAPPRLYQQRTRPCPATEILSSRHFPERNQGNLLVGNVIGFQGILQYKIDERDSSYLGTEIEPIVSSSDPKFRPVDLEIAPNGALYFTDWQNPIIGHMQHHIRDPNRDQEHGRVYRVIYPSRPLLDAPKVAGEPIEKLLDLLKSPEDRVRYRARIELSGRDTKEVVAAADQWIARLDSNDPDYQHHVTEALWLHQQHNVADGDVLRRVLQSPDHRARAAAVRVLCYWRDRVENSLALLKQAAADPHPRVRLEAVRAASFYKVPEAIEIPLIAAEQPMDEYLEFLSGETMKALEPYWKKALADGQKISVTSEAGIRYLLGNIPTAELLKLPRDRAVFVEVLYRPDVTDEQRAEALSGLAKLGNKSELRVLLDAIQGIDARSQNMAVVYSLVRMLTSRSSSELAGVRGELQAMATDARLPVLRQIGYVALISADGDAGEAWKLAISSASRLADFVNAVPLIPDAGVQADLYPQIAPLLNGLPESLASGNAPKGTYGRFVRIELPGKARTLTLAEVEVYSDGRNVARQGKATQNATAHGGEAKKGIDGNTKGSYGDGGQTHTPEDRPDPWWEVDLGAEYPIDSIVIYNRTDGDLGKRLDGFTLRVLDRNRGEAFRKEKIAAPKEKVSIEVGGGGPEGLVRRAAMNALTYIRGKEQETFRALAEFIRNDLDRLAAIRAIQRIPRRDWPQDEAASLVESLLAYIAKIPQNERTSPAALEALQLADVLTSLLPADAAKEARAQLGELGVQVVRIGTRPHRMTFDKDRLVIRAGKPVEFIFENSDIMPHNFVITEPGALEEIGLLAEATAQSPDAIARQFVPKSDKILLASALLQPLDLEQLSFNAPAKPGVYPYVCTYPGHWRRMHGALYVVENLDDYLADPEGYLAAHPLPIADELLKFNRPRKEWTFEELSPTLAGLIEPRSYDNARQMFQIASCVACHKLNGVGNEFGPDLTQLDPKLTHEDILTEILTPSKKINEKFQPYTFVLDNGKIVTGLVVEETPQAVKVIENPLVSKEPTAIPKSSIDERVKSPVSIMPQGLLDKLTLEEILDLVAYIAARGKEDHPLFQGGHDHAGHKH